MEQTTAHKIVLRKALLALALMLVVALAVAVPAFAQGGGPVTVTGVLERAAPHSPDPTPIYAVTDEATGATYEFVSAFVELEPYVGEWVAIQGVPVPGPGDPSRPPLYYAAEMETSTGLVAPPEPPASGETVTATFELTVQGQPPAGTGFSGSIGQVPVATGALLDQDGDGVYTTSLPVELGAVHGVRIERLDPISEEPQAPLVASTVKDFGEVVFDEDKTFTAGISFEESQPPAPVDPNLADECEALSPTPELCEVAGDGDSGDEASEGGGSAPGGSSGGIEGVLPDTGGGFLLLAGVGALLVAGGLLLRKVLW